MLYIASALSPTPILDTLSVPSFTPTAPTSLVVAKPDRVEVWDVNETGLVWRADLEVWGSIVSITKVVVKDTRPHLLVLLSPPNAHLLLISYQDSPKPSLVVTSSIPLTPPTPSLRQAEFFTSVIAHETAALVSLWVGVLSCIEIEVEKEKDAKKRRSSIAGAGALDVEEDGKRLKFKDNFNINIREHNLLHLAFLPPTPTQSEPSLTFLWQSSTNALQLQIRRLSLAAHSFIDASKVVDVVAPLREVDLTPETDFNDIPYSCPAARRVLPISSDTALVIGDEHSVLYTLSSSPSSPKVSRGSFSSAGGLTSSPRASAIRRSPQTEMLGTGKRRKSSISGRRSSLETGERLDLKPVWRVRQGFGTVLASSLLESHSSGASVILGDECGRLTALGWEIEKGPSVEGGLLGSVQLRKVDLGEVSPPSSLTYLDSSHVFLSSACGDSLLLTVRFSDSQNQPKSMSSSPTSSRAIPARKGKGRARDNEEGVEWSLSLCEDKGAVEVRERWMNLAPLKDFCVIGEEGGGVSHLVAASGASTSNSLRVIRSGVGLEDLTVVEDVTGVTNIIPLSQGFKASLLLSTSTSTASIEIEPEIAASQIFHEIASQPTIAAAYLDDGVVIHVSPRSVTIHRDLAGANPETSWTAGEGNEIVAAAISEEYAVVATRAGKVFVIAATEGTLREVIASEIEGEVSSVSIINHDKLPSPIIAIGTWSNEIIVYTLDHLVNGSSPVTTITESFYAASLMLKLSTTSMTSSGTQLIAGLSDGTMVIYDLEEGDSGGGLDVKSRKASSLGTRPLRLSPVEFKPVGDERVIAVGLSDRISVIFESKDRIEFSFVSRKDITAASGAHVPHLGGDVLVLAATTGISFSRVNSLKKLSVQTLDTAERSPTKLVSLNEQKLLGVGSVSRKMDATTGDVLQSGYFELRDSTSLSLLAEFNLNDREEVTCLSDVLLLGRHYVAVGTAIFPTDDEMDEFTHGGNTISAKEGRLLLAEPLFNAQSGKWAINVRTELKTVGPVHDVKVIHGFLAVAAGSKVTINRLDNSPFALRELSHFASAFIAQHLYVIAKAFDSTSSRDEERLVVGDGMRSIFVLEIDEGSGMICGEVRDMATHQVMGMEGVSKGEEDVVISDGYSNLVTFRLGKGDKIESAATFGLHEDIARFRKGSLVPPSSAPEIMTPELLFATSDGRLGVIGELTKGATKTLDDLQRNMDKYHIGPGGINWKTWRRGGTELIKKDTAGFIDGDFVQKYLNADLLPSAEGEKVLSGTNTHERISKIAPDGSVLEATRGDVARILEAASGLH